MKGKRFITLLLVGILVLSSSIVAFADDTESEAGNMPNGYGERLYGEEGDADVYVDPAKVNAYTRATYKYLFNLSVSSVSLGTVYSTKAAGKTISTSYTSLQVQAITISAPLYVGGAYYDGVYYTNVGRGGVNATTKTATFSIKHKSGYSTYGYCQSSGYTQGKVSLDFYGA